MKNNRSQIESYTEAALQFWASTLRLNDVDFSVSVVPSEDFYMKIGRHPHGRQFSVSVAELLIEQANVSLIWESACHEILHALFWDMTNLAAPVERLLSRSQREAAEAFLNEQEHFLVYKLQDIFTAAYPAPSLDQLVPQPKRKTRKRR
jgi:hypothetical protein